MLSKFISLLILATLFSGCVTGEKRNALEIPTFSTAQEQFAYAAKKYHYPAQNSAGKVRGTMLKNAIEAYGQVINQFPADRKWSAQAWLQIGNCHQLLGKYDTAIANYKIVLKQSNHQPALTAEAMKNTADAYLADDNVPQAAYYYRLLTARYGGREEAIFQQLVSYSQQQLRSMEDF